MTDAVNPEPDRLGDWLETASGIQFWPLDPRAEDIELSDIAHSLARICRFTGHCRRFYSVAEHSVRVARIVEPRHQQWALLHDAAEAYLHDLPRPLKHLPELAPYREAESRVERCVADRFRLPWPMPLEVKRADSVLLATEARDLMPMFHPWSALPPPLPDTIEPWDIETAQHEFLHLADSLGITSALHPQPGIPVRIA